MGESRPKHSKNQSLTGSLTRYGKSRRVPQVGGGPGLLGPASCGWGASHAAHARRSDAHQVPQSGRCRARGLHHRGPDPIAAQGTARRPRSGLFLRVDRRRALPGQRVSQGNRHRSGVSIDPHHHAQHGSARFTADRAEIVRLPSGHDPGDRFNRHRKDHDARLDDRSPQLDPLAQHHQPRGPHRVRSPQQDPVR